ncbi:hypothetical protein EPN29_09930 [bacterium]|nr:MAG: hypothetical protein EPN29_09930 [bacterium]
MVQFFRRKLPSFLGAAALAATFMASGVVNAAASFPDATCAGGTVAAGTYHSLTITGFCLLNGGNVTVQRNVVIQTGATLLAAFDGSNLSVGRDLLVGSNARLVLGCEPAIFPCFGDADGVTSDTIGNNLVAIGAKEVIAHHNTVWGEVAQTGGGGGLFCDFSMGFASLFYSTYEDNVIHGDATVADLKTCWLGFIRNTVWGTANLNQNSTFDEDGNEFISNTVHGNLNCFDNDPAAQVGDSGGSPNVVFGVARGQCAALSVPPAL